MGGGGRTPVQREDSPTDNQGARALQGVGGGRLPAETARSPLIVVLKLVMGGLTSVTSIVLSTDVFSSKVGLFPFP